MAILGFIEKTGSNDYTLRWIVNAVVPLIAKADLPQKSTAEIIKAMLPFATIRDLSPSVQPSIDKFPREMLELALELPEEIPGDWSRVLNKVAVESLIQLNLKNRDTVNAGNFNRLSSKRRSVVFKAFKNIWQDSKGFIPQPIITALPTEDRIIEARRHLRIPHIDTEHQDRMAFAAMLPWDESLMIIKEYLQAKDVETRAMAMEHQISAAKFQRERVADALKLVVQRRFENDVVRKAMIEALMRLPPIVWKSEHLETLRSVVDDTLSASDLSKGTAQWLNRLLLQLFRYQPHFALEQIVIFVQKQDEACGSAPNSEKLTTPEISAALGEALLPLVHQWMARKEYKKVTDLAEVLDENFQLSPTYLQIMEKIALESEDRWIPANALLVLECSKPNRKLMLQVVPKLLDADPSWISNFVVSQLLENHLQSLLDLYLTPANFKGKLNPDGQNLVPLFSKAPGRMSVEQQQVYSRTLVSFISDTTQHSWYQIQHLKVLSRLHFCEESAAAVAMFAHDERLVIRDTAVRRLAKLGEARGLPHLIEALGDDRARIAIYALGALLEKEDPARSLEILKSVKTTQVTVLKEIMRIIGDLETKEAFEYLMQKEQENGTHIDVRIAIIRRLWNYMSWPGVVATFERAVVDKEKELAKMIVSLPAISLNVEQKSQCLHILILGLSHPSPEVRLDALNRFCVTRRFLIQRALRQNLLPNLCSDPIVTWKSAPQPKPFSLITRNPMPS